MKTCENCKNWMTTGNAGFCKRLVVVGRGAGFILDVPETISRLRWEVTPTEYHHVVTPKYFRCAYWSKRRT